MPRLTQSNQKSLQFIDIFQHGLVMLAALSVLTLTLPVTAQAQDASANAAHYSIPPGSLEQSLNRFASQAGIAISMDADKIKNLTASRLEGNYSVETGLAALLKNSGFTFERNAAGYVLVQAKSIDGNAVKLPEVRVAGFMDPDAPGNPSYTRTNASTATRVDLPLMITPASVQVVPQAVLEDQQAIQIEDTVKNVSGVSPGFIFGGMSQSFMIRGFGTGFSG